MSEAATLQSHPVLVIERVFNADPKRVYEAWTKAESLQAWMGPTGFVCDQCDTDARVGGRYSMRLVGPSDSAHTAVGEYLDLVPSERLVFTFSWLQEDGAPGQRMQITIDLEELEVGKTKMRFFQENFIDREARDEHEDGWTGSFAKLGSFLSRDTA